LITPVAFIIHLLIESLTYLYKPCTVRNKLLPSSISVLVSCLLIISTPIVCVSFDMIVFFRIIEHVLIRKYSYCLFDNWCNVKFQSRSFMQVKFKGESKQAYCFDWFLGKTNRVKMYQIWWGYCKCVNSSIKLCGFFFSGFNC